MYGIDAANRLYIHVMIHKQRRIYGNIIVYSGEVTMECRECLRWHTVIIREQERAELKETKRPNVLDEDIIP